MARASKSRRGSKSRKTRRSKRKSGVSRRKRFSGGAQTVFPAGVADDSMLSASKLSAAQGLDYERIHLGQHGGAAVSLANSAPPGYTGMLDDSLRATARIEVLDQSISGIQGMSDQSGGGRRSRRSRRSRSKKGRKMMGGKRKKMCGGSGFTLANAQDAGAPGMLLSPNQEATALQGMNPEWKLAMDPGAFKPAGM